MIYMSYCIGSQWCLRVYEILWHLSGFRMTMVPTIKELSRTLNRTAEYISCRELTALGGWPSLVRNILMQSHVTALELFWMVILSFLWKFPWSSLDSTNLSDHVWDGALNCQSSGTRILLRATYGGTRLYCRFANYWYQQTTPMHNVCMGHLKIWFKTLGISFWNSISLVPCYCTSCDAPSPSSLTHQKCSWNGLHGGHTPHRESLARAQLKKYNIYFWSLLRHDGNYAEW